jgi:5'-nucleotidase
VRALITNDDGIDSVGLNLLAKVAVDAGLDVVVAAPHEERSGASASLIATRTDGRLLVEEVALDGLPDVSAYSVEATPAYVTWAGVRGAFGDPPDLVLSGVNKGPNTGHAILHSGTVGAALTADAHGLPAMAVSMSAPDPSCWETAASVAATALSWLLDHESPMVLNVNVPDIPVADLCGIAHAPLASFGAVQADIAEVGTGFVTLTFSEIDVSSEPDTDAGLLTFGWATVTALAAPGEASGLSLEGLAEPARRGS